MGCHTDGKGLWICTGSGQRYLARVRREGHQKYEPLGNPTKSLRVALRRLADGMASRQYKRGDVLLLAEWYDPSVLYEVVHY